MVPSWGLIFFCTPIENFLKNKLNLKEEDSINIKVFDLNIDFCRYMVL